MQFNLFSSIGNISEFITEDRCIINDVMFSCKAAFNQNSVRDSIGREKERRRRCSYLILQLLTCPFYVQMKSSFIYTVYIYTHRH